MSSQRRFTVLASSALWVAACASVARLPAPELAAPQIPFLHTLANAPGAPTLALPPLALPPLELPPLALPQQQSQQFGNGITLSLLPSAQAPYVFVQLAVDAGRLLYGSDADVIAEWLRQRGHAQTTALWSERWRALGGVLSVQSGPHRLLFSVEVLPVQADAAQALLQSMWQQARFDDPAMLAQVQRSLRVQQHQHDLAGGDIDRLWQQLAYGPGHPYADTGLSRDALQKVTLASLNTHWRQLQTERQRWLLAGALSEPLEINISERLAALPTREAVARWRQLDVPAPSNGVTNASSAAPAAMTIHLLHADAAAQVNVLVGVALALPDNAARWRCAAVASLLGNSFTGRVFADLRERRGLSYDAGGSCIAAPFASEFQLYGSSRPDLAVAFLHGLLGHLALLQQQPIGADEWQAVIDTLRGQSVLQLETARQRARSDNAQELLGGSWQTLRERDAFWQQLSADEASRFARQWLNGPPVIVLRGDADQLQRSLRQVWPEALLVRHDDMP